MLNVTIQLAYVKALLKRSYLFTYTPAADIHQNSTHLKMQYKQTEGVCNGLKNL